MKGANVKTLDELRDAAQWFLMLYGGPESTTLRVALLNPQPLAQTLMEVRRFLREKYPGVAGSKLTGADGLDMDEAAAATLDRDITARFDANGQPR